MRERYHFEDPGVDGRITIKWIFKKWDEEMDYWYGSEFGQVGGLMNVVMNLGVQYKAGNFLTG